MEDMWNVPGRVKPVALDYEAIMSDSFVTPPKRKVAKAKEGDAPAAPPPTGAGLKDQKELSVKENLELFIDSCNRLSARAISHPSIPLAFDKDDDDTLDFVLATANLRAIAYGIETKTRFQVKGRLRCVMSLISRNGRKYYPSDCDHQRHHCWSNRHAGCSAA